MEEHQEEIWKSIIIEQNGVIYDFTGLYMVSNLGRVKSLNYNHGGNEKVLKPVYGHHSYVTVCLTKNGKHTNFKVHRLVATAFIPNPDNLPVVNHKDENPANNNVDNLEWCTIKYNTQYSAYKISEAKTGISRSEETKQKLRDAVPHGKNHCKARAIICLNTLEVFDTCRDATKWCGLKSGSSIRRCCRDCDATAGEHPETGERLRWAYYDEWLKLQEEENDK